MNIVKYSFAVAALVTGWQLLAEKSVLPKHLEERTSKAAKSTSNLPEIYLIGDSIRIGYCKDVQRELDGKAEVKWPEGNCANSQNILINLGWWRKFASLPTVIQFNSGHWDASHWDGDAEAITSLEEYGKNMRLIIRRLRRYYPKAILVYATTTPMNPGGHRASRTTEQIREYNAVGVAIAKSEGVAVNDLFSWVEKWPASDWEDYCHFKPEANARLGKMIAENLMVRVVRAGNSRDRPL